jgi:hypothetical protein
VAAELRRGEAGQGEGQRFEVVEHDQAVEPELGLDGSARKAPVAVSQVHPVFGHRRRNGKRRLRRPLISRAESARHPIEVGLHRLRQARE